MRKSMPRIIAAAAARSKDAERGELRLEYKQRERKYDKGHAKPVQRE